MTGVVAVVAAVRIQQWISRTADLALVRGASTGLSEATSRAQIATLLQKGRVAGVVVDDQAPEVDGVVVLSATSPEAAAAAVEAVLAGLTQQLPGVEWVAWAQHADSYVQAYELVVGQGRPADAGAWHLPALTVDVPLGAACSGCGQEVAIQARRHTEKLERWGPDCAARFTANSWERVPGRARDFGELATRGGQIAGQPDRVAGRRDARNHLATVAADGNRVGELFKVLASMPPGVQAAVSAAMDDATAAAVEAAAAPWAGAAVAPMIVHYLGGDDVLLSVAAPCAWRFVAGMTAAFEDGFQQRLAEALTAVAVDEGARARLLAAAGRVSLGVGVVFAHAKHPFAHTQQVAHQAMRIAKRATAGEASAVAWADLTVEEGTAPSHWMSATDLVDDLAALGGTAGVSPAVASRRDVLQMNSSARQAVTAILNQGRLLGVPAVEQGHHLDQWALRTGHPLRTGNDAWTQERVDALAAVLDRARWWPAATAPPDAEPHPAGAARPPSGYPVTVRGSA